MGWGESQLPPVFSGFDKPGPKIQGQLWAGDMRLSGSCPWVLLLNQR